MTSSSTKAFQSPGREYKPILSRRCVYAVLHPCRVTMAPLVHGIETLLAAIVTRLAKGTQPWVKWGHRRNSWTVPRSRAWELASSRSRCNLAREWSELCEGRWGVVGISGVQNERQSQRPITHHHSTLSGNASGRAAEQRRQRNPGFPFNGGRQSQCNSRADPARHGHWKSSFWGAAFARQPYAGVRRDTGCRTHR